MPYSYTDFGSKSPGDTITVGFPFLSRDHVSVLVNDAEVSDTLWSWVTDGTIECLAGFPSGSGRVQRTTPADELAGMLTGTAVLDYPTLNENFTQVLYILQEKADQEDSREQRVVSVEMQLADTLEDVEESVEMAQKWAEENEDVAVTTGKYSAKHHALKAAASASSASGSAGSASGSAVAASGYATSAQKWASENEDVVVSGGLYSARHYAAKASAYLAGIMADLAGWIHAAASLSTPHDDDELAFASSENSWALRKFKWSDLKNHSHPDATTSEAGFMPAADKAKLDGVGTMANRNVTISTGDPSGGSDGDIHYKVV